MERIDLLIQRIRRYTGTQSFTDSATGTAQTGVQTQMIVDLLNDAQHSLHGTLFSMAPSLFITTDTQNIVADQEAYSLPSDAFLGRNLISVDYKNGTGSDYYKLTKKDSHLRASDESGDPYQYVQHNKSILLNPVPDRAVANGLRITYEYALPELDVRRGKVSVVDDGSNPTSITITNTTHMDIAFGSSDDPEYITVVDKDGVIQMDQIAVSAYDSGTGVITCAVSADATELVSVNDYVVIGKRASTHSELPGFCELFLTKFVEHAIMEITGHPGTSAAAQQLQYLTMQMGDVFLDYNTDITEIPIHDPSRIIGYDSGYNSF